MGILFNKKSKAKEGEQTFYSESKDLFREGEQYPPIDSYDRLARYIVGRKIFKGEQEEVFRSMKTIMPKSEHAEIIDRMVIALNISEAILQKPADFLAGEPFQMESGKAGESKEQKALERIASTNRLQKLVHEMTVANGYRGDSFIKVRYNYRVDTSAIPAGLPLPDDLKMEPIIESVKADYVFPELARGSNKEFKAINIGWIEWVDDGKKEIPFLNVEKHVPGYILYSRFEVFPLEVTMRRGVPISGYRIGKKVPTGRQSDVVATGLSEMAVIHVPYKSTDETWEGGSMTDTIFEMLEALHQRLAQLRYILYKHSDVSIYGPNLLATDENSTVWGGVYIPLEKGDVTPGAITWDGQLDIVMKEIDFLVGTIFQVAEVPMWILGTTTTSGGNQGGTGTSHTDSASIKMRHSSILSKVNRIKIHVDYAIRKAMYLAQKLEHEANKSVSDFEEYTITEPTIAWSDGLPVDIKYLVETVMQGNGGKPIFDNLTAVKMVHQVNDEQAQQLLDRIEEEEKQANTLATSSIFNQETAHIPEPNLANDEEVTPPKKEEVKPKDNTANNKE